MNNIMAFRHTRRNMLLYKKSRTHAGRLCENRRFRRNSSNPCKLCVILLRPCVLLGVCPHWGYRSATPLSTSVYKGQQRNIWNVFRKKEWSSQGCSQVMTRPTGGLVRETLSQKAAGRVGSGQEVLQISRVESGLGSGGISNIAGQAGLSWPDPIPARRDPTCEQPWKFHPFWVKELGHPENTSAGRRYLHRINSTRLVYCFKSTSVVSPFRRSAVEVYSANISVSQRKAVDIFSFSRPLSNPSPPTPWFKIKVNQSK